MSTPIMVAYVKLVLVPYRERLAAEANDPEIRKRPLVLVLDRCSVHLTAEVRRLLAENNILVIWVVANMTGKLQPLDVGVMSSFKSKVVKFNEERMFRNLCGEASPADVGRRAQYAVNATEAEQIATLMHAVGKINRSVAAQSWKTALSYKAVASKVTKDLRQRR